LPLSEEKEGREEEVEVATEETEEGGRGGEREGAAAVGRVSSGFFCSSFFWVVLFSQVVL